MSQKKNRERWNRLNRERHLKLKTEAINAYGGKCVCCGEPEVKFLTLDHIDKNGDKHRKELRVEAGVPFYAKLKKLGYPDCGLQVMCANCHIAKDKYGQCPHKAP